MSIATIVFGGYGATQPANRWRVPTGLVFLRGFLTKNEAMETCEASSANGLQSRVGGGGGHGAASNECDGSKRLDPGRF